jgi:hypothetical protein
MESAAFSLVNSASKLRTSDSDDAAGGLNSGVYSLLRTFAQSRELKKLLRLTSSAPVGPEPSLAATRLSSSPLKQSRAGSDNCCLAND